jgi:hypothetical protein
MQICILIVLLQGKGRLMHKMNFEQKAPASRDIGGPSGTILLLVAIAVCTVWALEPLLLHAR